MKIGTEQVLIILLRKKRSEVRPVNFRTTPELDFDSRSEKTDPRTSKTTKIEFGYPGSLYKSVLESLVAPGLLECFSNTFPIPHCSNET